jgi:hypothetical protein
MARRGERTRTGPRPIEGHTLPAAADPTWDRPEDQPSWYERKSGDNQRATSGSSCSSLRLPPPCQWWPALTVPSG